MRVKKSCCSVAQPCLDSLRPHGLSPRACSNSCPLSWWCLSTILSSVTPFSSCLQSFPASGSFLMSWLFASGGQSIGASAAASVLPMNIQDWFPLGWTGLISLQSRRISRVFPSCFLLYPIFLIHQRHSFEERKKLDLSGQSRLPRQSGASGKESASNAGDIRDASSIPGSGRFPGEGSGNPLQYACLENPMDRGPWRAAVHSVIESQTRPKRLSVVRAS